MNPYGECGHTKYEGCPPCIHDAYQRGREDAARAFLSALGEGTFDDALAAARGDGAE